MAHGTKTTLRPLHDRILVKRLAEVGAGKVTDEGKKIPLDVKAGDRILFGKYSGSEVKLDGQEYLTMREEDVLGILSA